MSQSSAYRCVFESFDHYDMIEPDDRDLSTGVAFRRALSLPVGRFAWLVQWQVEAEAWEKLHSVSIRVSDLATEESLGAAEARISTQPISAEDLDAMVLVTDTTTSRNVEIVGTVSGALGRLRLRHLKVVEFADEIPSRDTFVDPAAQFQSHRLTAVFIGATNVCNASCPHCPANKTMTAHLAQGVMDMQLFESLILQLEEITVDDCILFGVFGEPFNDPLLVERVKFIKNRWPEMPIEIATNAGAVNMADFAVIAEHVRRISVHVEAVSPATYNRLMWPLKAADVFPLIDQMVDRAADKIEITTPIHRGNMHEAAAVRRRWGRKGAGMRFARLQTRATDRTAAKNYALAPVPGYWSADLVDILVVDWDGTVLLTCDDFLRRQPLGNLRDQSLKQILDGPPRREAFRKLSQYRWTEMPSLYDAVVDDADWADALSSIDPASDTRIEIPASRFSHVAGCVSRLGHIEINSGSFLSGPVVFGPYLRVPIGRYIARFSGVAEMPGDLSLTFEVTTDFGHRRLASVQRSGTELTKVRVATEFIHDDARGSLEFRIIQDGGNPGDKFQFEGVLLTYVQPLNGRF